MSSPSKKLLTPSDDSPADGKATEPVPFRPADVPLPGNPKGAGYGRPPPGHDPDFDTGETRVPVTRWTVPRILLTLVLAWAALAILGGAAMWWLAP